MLSGLSLDYLLSTPSGRSDAAEAPLVVLMHGRGADAHDLAELAPLLDSPPGFRFVFPNAPRPWEAYPGTSFGFTWFEGWPPLHQSLVESRERLLRFLGEIVERLPVPTGRLVLGGFSQGALMALDAGLRITPAPGGIVSLSGGLYETGLDGSTAPGRPPVFLAHGVFDDVVPLQYAQRARRVLEDAGTEVEYREYPMGHQIVMEEIDGAREFIRRCLGS